MNKRTVVHFIFKFAIRQHIKHAAHGFFGIVLHMLHIRLHDIQTEMADHAF